MLPAQALPQGAPTSPALSNIVGYEMDRKSCSVGCGIRVTYTRYADDSQPFREMCFERADHPSSQTDIQVDEKFEPNHKKTHFIIRVVGRLLRGVCRFRCEADYS